MDDHLTEYMISFVTAGKAQVVEVSAPSLSAAELFACKKLSRDNWPVPTTYKIFQYHHMVLDENGEVQPRGPKTLVMTREQ